MPQKRKPKKWIYPLAVERDYEALLLALANNITQQIEDRLPLLDLRLDAIEDIPPSSGWFERLRLWVLSVAGAVAVDDTLIKINSIAGALNRFNANQFRAVFRSVFGVDILASEPWLAAELATFEAENIKLIKSIPSQYLDTLHGRIVAAVGAGSTKDQLINVIRQSFDLPKNRAKLIARDQISKLNGRLTMQRQRGIGVESYVWRTSKDERVRDEHRARDGDVFAWDNPPADGHPGNAVNCRCSAEAVLPDLQDLRGFVYDNKV